MIPLHLARAKGRAEWCVAESQVRGPTFACTFGCVPCRLPPLIRTSLGPLLIPVGVRRAWWCAYASPLNPETARPRAHDTVHWSSLIRYLCYDDGLQCWLKTLAPVAMTSPGLGEGSGGGGAHVATRPHIAIIIKRAACLTICTWLSGSIWARPQYFLFYSSLSIHLIINPGRFRKTRTKTPAVHANVEHFPGPVVKNAGMDDQPGILQRTREPMPAPTRRKGHEERTWKEMTGKGSPRLCLKHNACPIPLAIHERKFIRWIAETRMELFALIHLSPLHDICTNKRTRHSALVFPFAFRVARYVVQRTECPMPLSPCASKESSVQVICLPKASKP